VSVGSKTKPRPVAPPAHPPVGAVVAPPAEPPVPHSFVGYLKGMGPGIVVALSWLGTGDLINSSVSGANYGYVLMWALVIATLARFFVVSALTKYQLCNSTNDQTILEGFQRVWRGFPMFLGIASVLLGVVYHCFLFLGAGTALYYLFGEFGGDWGIFMWAVVVLAAVVFMASRPNEYKWLEVVANLAMATLVLIFRWALVGSGIDVGAFIDGLTFSVPDDRGAYGAWLVVVAIIGAVGGSVANLMYPYFVSDKGWRGPRYRKLQVYDLLFGVSTLIVLNIAIWIVAAELMRGRGATIEGPEDLARMMELAIGPAGPTLLWLAVFFAVFDNIGTQVYAFPRMAVEACTRRSRSGPSGTGPSCTAATRTRRRPRRTAPRSRTWRRSATSAAPRSCATRCSAGSRPSCWSRRSCSRCRPGPASWPSPCSATPSRCSSSRR
jgi:Mn2+/Fe2+ NRAMP family transporter